MAGKDLHDSILFILVIMFFLIGSFIALYFLAEKDKSKYKDSTTSLLVNLLGTFFGVFLAVFFSELHTKQLERDQLRAIFSMAMSETASQHTTMDKLTKENDTAQLIKNLEKNPVTPPAGVDAILSNPLLEKYTPMMYPALSRWRIRLKDDIQQFSSSKLDINTRKTYIRAYLTDLMIMAKSIEAGYKYIDGKIDDRGFLDEFGKILENEPIQ